MPSNLYSEIQTHWFSSRYMPGSKGPALSCSGTLQSFICSGRKGDLLRLRVSVLRPASGATGATGRSASTAGRRAATKSRPPVKRAPFSGADGEKRRATTALPPSRRTSCRGQGAGVSPGGRTCPRGDRRSNLPSPFASAGPGPPAAGQKSPAPGRRPPASGRPARPRAPPTPRRRVGRTSSRLPRSPSAPL